MQATTGERSNGLERIRGSIKNWWREQKMRAKLRSMKSHFERKIKVRVGQTGDTPDDFEVIRRIGGGAYSKVELVRFKKSQQLSAVKIMDMSRTQRIYLENEIQVLFSVLHPFVASIKGHFTFDDKVYLKMPYYAGGSLHSFLREHGRCSPELARFYGVQLVMGIDFLHGVGVVHRDLKPKNIVLDADGYLKIVDFGISIRTAGDRLYTLCGTPKYMAPEVYFTKLGYREGYGKSVDWWAFGLIMFSVITGGSPFSDCCVYLDIVSCDVRYPDDMDVESLEFLQGILRINDELRLGCRRGAREYVKHPWFRGVDWAGVFFKKVKAPYVPEPQTGPDLMEHVNNDGIKRNASCIANYDFNEF